MQQTLMNKLHEYIRENNPDLLFQLEEDGKVTEYLSDKISTVSVLIKQMDIGQPAYIIEDACMDVMTQDLRPSKFNYISNLLQEEFESTYNQIQESGTLKFEVINLINQCQSVFEDLNFSDENEKVLMPVSATFRIKGSIFYQEGSYHESRFLANQKAILYTICELNRVPSTYEQVLNEKENREPLPASAERFRPETAIDQYRTAPNEAEVDLHISALRNEYSKLSPHEILTIQMGFFERMLGSAIAFRYSHVVFIHGIGNGTLKQTIIQRLAEYEDIEFRNASFAKYGNGAIELVIHRNK